MVGDVQLLHVSDARKADAFIVDIGKDVSVKGFICARATVMVILSFAYRPQFL
jgi:hypothetical protein